MPSDILAPVLALPGVAESAARARDAVDALLSNRILRRRSAEVTAESALRGARASAELEGAPIELERLRGQLMAGAGVTARDDRTSALVNGAVRVHADLGSVVGAWTRSPRQALARLHMLAARDIAADPEALGRPRPVGASYDDPLGLGPAPEPLEVAARLDGLSRVITEPTSAPAVVLAAVVHGELLALRAFGVADGVVARAASRLVLISRGLDPKAVTAPEVGHAELHHEYADRISGYVSGGPEGVAAWVAHCADALILGAREGTAVCEALRRDAS